MSEQQSSQICSAALRLIRGKYIMGHDHDRVDRVVFYRAQRAIIQLEETILCSFAFFAC